MEEQFQIEMTKLAEEATERCRNEREKAEKLIKDTLDSLDAAGNSQAESLRQQIIALQASLQNRKKLIQELTAA